MKIQIINGPNLNLLGVRQPDVYGRCSFENFLPQLRAHFQDVGFSVDGIVLNAGAYTHTSIALQDCIRSLKCPVVEVHISNVHQREDFRHHSFLSPACLGVICGFGLHGYAMAIDGIIAHKSKVE